MGEGVRHPRDSEECRCALCHPVLPKMAEDGVALWAMGYEPERPGGDSGSAGASGQVLSSTTDNLTGRRGRYIIEGMDLDKYLEELMKALWKGLGLGLWGLLIILVAILAWIGIASM